MTIDIRALVTLNQFISMEYNGVETSFQSAITNGDVTDFIFLLKKMIKEPETIQTIRQTNYSATTQTFIIEVLTPCLYNPCGTLFISNPNVNAADHDLIVYCVRLKLLKALYQCCNEQQAELNSIVNFKQLRNWLIKTHQMLSTQYPDFNQEAMRLLDKKIQQQQPGMQAYWRWVRADILVTIAVAGFAFAINYGTFDSLVGRETAKMLYGVLFVPLAIIISKSFERKKQQYQEADIAYSQLTQEWQQLQQQTQPNLFATHQRSLKPGFLLQGDEIDALGQSATKAATVSNALS